MKIFKFLSKIFLWSITIMIILTGCGTPPVHDLEQIKTDIVGKKFIYHGDKDLSDYSFNIINQNNIKSLSINKRLTDEKNKSDEVYLQAEFENDKIIISGEFELKYRLYNEGWKLDSLDMASTDSVKVKTKFSELPDIKRIKSDLIGKEILYKGDTFDGETLIIKDESQIKDIQIKKRETDKKFLADDMNKKIDEIHMNISLLYNNKTLKGKIVIQYYSDITNLKKGWTFYTVGRDGANDFIEQ